MSSHGPASPYEIALAFLALACTAASVTTLSYALRVRRGVRASGENHGAAAWADNAVRLEWCVLVAQAALAFNAAARVFDNGDGTDWALYHLFSVTRSAAQLFIAGGVLRNYWTCRRLRDGQ